MKILYVAPGQRVPGHTGGSVHVASVVSGLAALGHEVLALVSRGEGPFPDGPARWVAMGTPMGQPCLRRWRSAQVELVARQFGAEAIIERAGLCGGEGLRAARATGAVAVLDVAMPLVDDPGSPRAWLDRALMVRPLAWWCERYCREADLIVTPAASLLPAGIDTRRVVETDLGADTVRFTPKAAGPLPFVKRPQTVTVIFAGAFRAWQGATHLARAARTLRAKGRRDIHVVMLGDGPDYPKVRAMATSIDTITLTGAVAHTMMPACLAAGDIGVASFDVGAHPPPLRTAACSPLQIFEYMAAGLPVVAPAVGRLGTIIRHGEDGMLYAPAEPDGLARSIEALADDAPARATLGQSARTRVKSLFSVSAHCGLVASAIADARSRR